MPELDSNNKVIARNTIFLYVRMLLLLAVNLYTSRLVLQILGITDFGVFNVVGGIVVLFTFVSGSLSDSTRRFLTFELGQNNCEGLIRVFSTSFFLHIGFALLVLFLSETIGLWILYNELNIPSDRFTASVWVFHCSILTTILTLLNVPYTATIIAHERMEAFAFMSILEAILKLIVVFCLMEISYDKLILYALLLIIVQAIILCFYIIYSRKYFNETKIVIVKDLYLFKKMASFIGWTMTGAIATMLNGQGLNMLLNIYFGPAINASRGIALQLQGVLSKFCANFQTALNPQITKTYAAGNLVSMHKLVVQSSKFSYYLLLALSLPVFFSTDFVILLWLGVVPEHTVNFFRLILVINLMSVLSNSMVASIHATGNLKLFQLVVEAVNMSVLPISYFLLESGHYPPEIVYVVYALISILAQLVRVYIVLPRIKMSYRFYCKDVILPIIIVTITALVCPSLVFFAFDHTLMLNIMLICLAFASVILCVVCFGITDTERFFIKNMIVGLWKKE